MNEPPVDRLDVSVDSTQWGWTASMVEPLHLEGSGDTPGQALKRLAREINRIWWSRSRIRELFDVDE